MGGQGLRNELLVIAMLIQPMVASSRDFSRTLFTTGDGRTIDSCTSQADRPFNKAYHILLRKKPDEKLLNKAAGYLRASNEACPSKVAELILSRTLDSLGQLEEAQEAAKAGLAIPYSRHDAETSRRFEQWDGELKIQLAILRFHLKKSQRLAASR